MGNISFNYIMFIDNSCVFVVSLLVVPALSPSVLTGEINAIFLFFMSE